MPKQIYFQSILEPKFEKALSNMPNVFTSNQFGKELRKIGIPLKITSTKGRIANWLKPRCKQSNFTNRMWYKKQN